MAHGRGRTGLPHRSRYSVDLLGKGHSVPNYLAVNLLNQLPTHSIGMWPAPLAGDGCNLEHIIRFE